jgi:hypothetical protein
MMSENPFELLQLPPTAGEEEAVRQGARLAQRAPDESARNAIRQAVRQLTGAAEERALHALLTHPRPEHGNADLERFLAAHRRGPAAEAHPQPCPSLDLEEVRALLRQVLAAEIEPPAMALEPVIADDPPEEIARQTAEALWQSLVSDSRA